MDNMFEGLERLGLDKLREKALKENKGTDISKTTVKNTSTVNEIVNKEEKSILFDKTYKCPVCGKDFKAKTVKVGKAQLKNVELDLRPVYKSYDVLKYDAIVCEECGYASLAKFFSPIMDAQINLVKENVWENFKGIDNSMEVFTYEDAILRHQMALESSIVKKAKESEKAYTCLKLAWLTRGKREMLQELNADKNEITNLEEKEEEYISKAYKGFSEALSKERFPIAGMDETMFMYLMADLARRCKDYDLSKQFISKVLSSRAATQKIKEKARELFEVLKKETQ